MTLFYYVLLQITTLYTSRHILEKQYGWLWNGRSLMNKDIRGGCRDNRAAVWGGRDVEGGEGELSLYPKALGLGIIYIYNRKLDRWIVTS